MNGFFLGWPPGRFVMAGRDLGWFDPCNTATVMLFAS
jgi:hypothetical protein